MLLYIRNPPTSSLTSKVGFVGLIRLLVLTQGMIAFVGRRSALVQYDMSESTGFTACAPILYAALVVQGISKPIPYRKKAYQNQYRIVYCIQTHLACNFTGKYLYVIKLRGHVKQIRHIIKLFQNKIKTSRYIKCK